MPPSALFFELALPILIPPALGAFIGFCTGWATGRRVSGAIGGGVGGVIGAWMGIATYWKSVLPSGPDLGWFTLLILAGLFVGAVGLAFPMVIIMPARERPAAPNKTAE